MSDIGIFPDHTDQCLRRATWPDYVPIQAEGGIVMDADTGTVLYGKNIHTAYYPASITKIMTLILIFDAMQSGKIHLTDEVVTSAHANPWADRRCFWRKERSRRWRH